MNLIARIKKVEAVVGKGKRYCPYCRLFLRNSWPDPKKENLESGFKAKCEFCHTERTINLANMPEDEREVMRYFLSLTIEDRYTDPKANAFTLWMKYRPERTKKSESRPEVKNITRADPNSLLLEKLRNELGSLIKLKHRRLKSKYGGHAFPEHTRLIEAVKERERTKTIQTGHVPGLYKLKQEKINHLICAELEKIIWGKTKPERESAIWEKEREIDNLVRTTEQDQMQRKEELRRKNLEFLNKNRASVGLAPLPDD